MSTFVDKLVFPAPLPTYSRDKDPAKKHLCWIPWNEAVSPDRVDDERFAEGIPCMWLPSPKAAGVILFCHGNAEDLGMCLPFLKHMQQQFKMNVLAAEYPGYGLLHHVPASEAGLKEVALTAFRFVLDELKVAYEQIILFGRSVGSGPSVYLASRFPIGGLILVAAFTSVREAAKSLVGEPIAQFLDDRFPNISLIGNVSCPTLFIHGEKDSLVPPTHSVALFKACRARKLLITPPGMEHNTNLFTDAQFLAIPAINFFGLPGYQQDEPPQMPQRFYENGRQQFLLRQSARRKQQGNAGQQDSMAGSPWFFFCGCPTNRVKRENLGMDSQLPQRDKQPFDWEPEGSAEWDPTTSGEELSGSCGDIASAGRDTSASMGSGAILGGTVKGRYLDETSGWIAPTKEAAEKEDQLH